MQFRFCDKKLTAIFWHCTRACHVVLPSDPNGNPAARGYSSCSLEFRTRRLSLTADGPGTRKFVWNDGPVCVTWFPFFKVKGKSGHTNWTILWNVHFLSPLAWKTRPGEFFESFVVRNCGDSFCLHNIWQNQGGIEWGNFHQFHHSMPPWFAREAFRHLLDQNSIDKDFDQSLTPVPAAESAAESGTRKFVWNDGPVCVTWFPSYLQPWALERSWSYKRWYCQYLSACRVWLFSHDLSRSQFHWETESMLHQGHCWLVVLLPSSNDVGCEFTVNCHCDGRRWGVDLQYKPSRLGPPVTLCDYDSKDNG